MDIKQPLASMMLDKVLDVPDWAERARCYTHNSDENGLVRLDPFDEDDYEEFARELCGKCPVVSECREAITRTSENVRTIESGIFHGVQYPVEQEEGD